MIFNLKKIKQEKTINGLNTWKTNENERNYFIEFDWIELRCITLKLTDEKKFTDEINKINRNEKQKPKTKQNKQISNN